MILLSQTDPKLQLQISSFMDPEMWDSLPLVSTGDKLGRCVLELLSVKRVLSFQFVREEVADLIDKICCAFLCGAPINLSELLHATSNNIVSRCALGRKADEEGGRNKFGELLRRMSMQFTSFCFGDLFHSSGWMDNLTGLIARFRTTFREVDALLYQVIREHTISESDENQFAEKDFVHALLQLQKDGNLEIQLTQDNLKAILMDILVGGSETTAIIMEWVTAELVKDQNEMRKAQEEVRRVVGNKSMVETNDVDQMNYLKCVIKETLRLHPPLPLMVPRETSISVKMGGYTIPPKTKVLVKTLAIQTDPKLWERPEEFIPERLENNSVDFKGQDFQFIPFGGGRRGCPGSTFGVASAEFVIANLLYWFDWKLPDGEAQEGLDLSEAYGLSVSKKIPLHLVPSLYCP